MFRKIVAIIMLLSSWFVFLWNWLLLNQTFKEAIKNTLSEWKSFWWDGGAYE